MFWVSLCEYLYIICQFNEYFWFVFAELEIKPRAHALPLSPTPVLIQIHFYFFHSRYSHFKLFYLFFLIGHKKMPGMMI